MDYDTELKSIAKFDKKKTYVLQDRNIISVGAGRFHCADMLYQSGFIVQEAYGIHDTSYQNIVKCDVDTRKDLCDNVVLASGTTTVQGIVEHMTNELTSLAPSTMRSRWLLRLGMDWRICLVCVLPDGNIITVGAERFCHVEVLLQPNFIGEGASEIHDTSFSSNMKIDVSHPQGVVRLCRVVRLTTMFQGTGGHMTNELMFLAPSTMKVQVVAPPE